MTELALDPLQGDLVTKRILAKAVRDAANDLEYTKIENNAGGVTGRLWRKLGKLRLDDKNGARYTVNAAQDEIRAVRNMKKWRETDGRRDMDAIVAELKINMSDLGLGDAFP